MIPGTNAMIKESALTNDTLNREIEDITKQLDERFELYKPSIDWILETADLLRKYKLLTGNVYEIKSTEDSII